MHSKSTSKDIPIGDCNKEWLGFDGIGPKLEWPITMQLVSFCSCVHTECSYYLGILISGHFNEFNEVSCRLYNLLHSKDMHTNRVNKCEK